MAKALIGPPGGLSVSLETIKAHLRVETGDEDEYLFELATTASSLIERHCGLSLMTQTWRFYFDGVPADGRLELDQHPVQSVAMVTIYDSAGDAQLLDPQFISLDRVSRPARLRLSGIQPDQAANGIEVDAVCGFGDTGADVPDELKRAILVLTAHWHSVRGSADDAALTGLVPDGFDRLTAPWRRTRL